MKYGKSPTFFFSWARRARSVIIGLKMAQLELTNSKNLVLPFSLSACHEYEYIFDIQDNTAVHFLYHTKPV
jgi:hypothetical protein